MVGVGDLRGAPPTVWKENHVMEPSDEQWKYASRSLSQLLLLLWRRPRLCLMHRTLVEQLDAVRLTGKCNNRARRCETAAAHSYDDPNQSTKVGLRISCYCKDDTSKWPHFLFPNSTRHQKTKSQNWVAKTESIADNKKKILGPNALFPNSQILKFSQATPQSNLLGNYLNVSCTL